MGKVELSWRMLSVYDWERILKCFDRRYGGKFYNDVIFFDMVRGNYTTRTMYVSDRSASMWHRDPETGEIDGWLNCTLNLIEV